MLQFFSGGGGTQKFNSTPTAGKPSIAIGNGTFGGGADPDFQGTSAIGVNMASGYTNNLLDLQIAGVSFLRVQQVATQRLNLLDGSLSFGSAQNDNNTIYFGGANGGYLSGANGGIFTRSFGLSGATEHFQVRGFAAPNTLLSVLASPGQTGDLLALRDSAPVTQFGIANNGTDVAPKWVIRVAPTANAESMVQAHVGGASTGNAIQIIDAAGSSLGWLQLVT